LGSTLSDDGARDLLGRPRDRDLIEPRERNPAKRRVPPACCDGECFDDVDDEAGGEDRVLRSKDDVAFAEA
jgi:hypothetical protein